MPPRGYIVVDVMEGNIYFQKSVVQGVAYKTARNWLESCPDAECRLRVQQGQRVAADWPPKSSSPEADSKP